VSYEKLIMWILEGSFGATKNRSNPESAVEVAVNWYKPESRDGDIGIHRQISVAENPAMRLVHSDDSVPVIPAKVYHKLVFASSALLIRGHKFVPKQFEIYGSAYPTLLAVDR